MYAQSSQAGCLTLRHERSGTATADPTAHCISRKYVSAPLTCFVPLPLIAEYEAAFASDMGGTNPGIVLIARVY
jgi:hypothetical protein